MSVAIKARLTLLAALGAVIIGNGIVHYYRLRQPVAPVVMPVNVEQAATESMIRFLEGRVRRAPDDHVAQNMLAGAYLRHIRQTSNPDDLALAFRATRASLRSVPGFRNTGGLRLLAHEEYASHAFAEARDHALELTRLVPKESAPYQVLGDALLELGEYDKAAAAYQQMQRLDGGVETETRLARLSLLHGDRATASRRLATALAFAIHLSPSSRETVAWCHWQLGDVAFAGGDYPSAERHYRNALAAFPGYVQALASLGRVRAARGDRVQAVAQYERAVHILPNTVFMAALGDLYHLSGREEDAQAQYALVIKSGQASKGSDTLPDRQLALFYADHNLQARKAYEDAARMYKDRHDVYGADILAWTALKAGKKSQAQAAIKAALRLGTQDARFLYHAGMIARAMGNKTMSRDYLQRALTLNPRFDPLQAVAAGKALQEDQTAAGIPGSPSIWKGAKRAPERAQSASPSAKSGRLKVAGGQT